MYQVASETTKKEEGGHTQDVEEDITNCPAAYEFYIMKIFHQAYSHFSSLVLSHEEISRVGCSPGVRSRYVVQVGVKHEA